MGEGEGTRRARGAAWLAIAVCVLPALHYLRLDPRAGELQWHDYYIVLSGMIAGDRLQTNPLRWLTIKSNEHTVAVPALIYAVNLALFRGDNRPLAVFAVLAQLALVLVLFFRAPPDLRRTPLAAGLAAAIAGLAFTPVGSHQFILGFSGVMWVTADLLAVVALVALEGSAETKRPAGWLVVALAAAGLGTLTFSTALVVWPALLLGALLLPPLRRKLPWLALAALVAVHFAAALYQRPPHHPPLVLADLGALWSFITVFLGWIFSPRHGVAAALGFIGLVAAGGLWLTAVRGGDSPVRRLMLPWLLLQIYGLGNAAMAAVTRSGFGTAAASSGRYALLAALFWIGILGALGVRLWCHSAGRARAAAGAGRAALALLAVVQTWRHGAGFARSLLTDAAYHPVAAIALRHEIADDWAFRHFQNVAARTWLDGAGRATRPFMRAHRHVPFDRTPDPAFGDIVPLRAGAAARAAGVAGEVRRVTGVGGGVVRVEGWVDAGGETVSAAAVVTADGLVRGEIAMLPHLPVAGAAGRPRAVAFAGYALPRSPGEKLQVVVRCRSDSELTPVGSPFLL